MTTPAEAVDRPDEHPATARQQAGVAGARAPPPGPAPPVDQEPARLRGPGRRRRPAPRHRALARRGRLRHLLPGRLGDLLPQRRPRRRGRPPPPDQAPPPGGRRRGPGAAWPSPSGSSMLAAADRPGALAGRVAPGAGHGRLRRRQLAYSLGLKNEPILDLACVSAGFVLRAVAGGVATGGPLSNWFLIVASFGSLLIVTGKRSGEKQLLAEQRHRPRPPSARPSASTPRRSCAPCAPCRPRSRSAPTACGPSSGPPGPPGPRPDLVPADHHPLRHRPPPRAAAARLGRRGRPEELALQDHRLQIYGVCWVALFAIGVYAAMSAPAARTGSC